MAGHAPEIEVKKHPKAKVAIISSSWHPELCGDLIAGARRALEAAEVKKIEVIFVPGSFEIPLAAQKAFEKNFDAVVAVGLVLKGETPHFDYVCQGVTQGVIDVSSSGLDQSVTEFLCAMILIRLLHVQVWQAQKKIRVMTQR
jgi:6,7-dimethyl-8-ribityllumazine synthase